MGKKENLLFDIDDIIESSRDSVDASEGTDSQVLTSRSVESNDKVHLARSEQVSEVTPPKNVAAAEQQAPAKAQNHHEKWQANLHEKIERLKKQEVEETKARTKQAAEELEKWHVDRNTKIQENLQKLLLNEPKEAKRDIKDPFDWEKCAKYVQESDYFPIDQSHGNSQKLIELVMKRKNLHQNA
ncbi:conserved hypothetical protein [Theileria equi strain WA]|uniref:Clathrin light chain n=1 Tax=Theileria equi strain WA TaxID=1537102 RepID=L1LDI9_THEEQ|nr:conserved hypothetical protein [Theileria equi strain WA]EKX73416.1 conserved hypothetical protein [Theileria equi strain WA]|eukprot:XP_004832868.1 conserved hypothetical protein [Theileria equi strain WA]